MGVVDLVIALDGLDPDGLDRDGVNASLVVVGRVRAWLDACQGRLVRRLDDLAETNPCGPPPEVDIAAATKVSRGDAARAGKRARVLGAVPEVEAALADGDVSVAHVDVLERAMNGLDADQRALLAAQHTRLVAIATRCTPEHFARVLRRELERLDPTIGEDRLAKQQRNSGVRYWIDPDTGMWCLRGEFDPATGLQLQGILDNKLEGLFHAGVPDTCPTGERKQDHLRALALVSLITGSSGEPRNIDDVDNRFEVSVIIDLDTLQHGLHDHTIIDTGTNAELPIESYRRMACMAAIIPIVLNTDGVVVDLGRSVRLANRAQRRALRAMYTTCAIPGCAVRSKHCEPHHIHYWQHGGNTNLQNLLPLCTRHHHNVHEGGWQLHLDNQRQLTITYPNNTTQTTGPPATQRAA